KSVDENGDELIIPLKSERRLVYECYEYADYYSRMECVRPMTGYKKFDIWIETAFKDWVRANLEKFKSIDSGDIGTNERWSQTAYGWVDVDLFLNDMISGTIYMQSSWSPVTRKKAFIYDLKNGKEMILQDIFERNFESKSFFDLLIPAMKKEFHSKPELKTWIEGQRFEHITIKDNGISFKTDFNTIYGEKEILIPFANLTDKLKHRSLIKALSGK
ncbi:MAG: hypothetical protein H7X99_04710, partial [Saprospiraceae bacterium]|nr:hypothetical protein [Saprospiraceae bacterium]